MSHDSRNKWVVKNYGDYIILSGGVLNTKASVLLKAEEKLGKTLNHNSPVGPRECIMRNGSMRFYYAIDCRTNTHDSHIKFSDVITKENANYDYKPYYYGEFDNSVFKAKTYSSPCLISLAFVSILAPLMIPLSESSIVLPTLISLLSVIISVALFNFAIRIKYPVLISYQAKDGVVYVINRDEDEHETYSSMNPEMIDKVLKRLKRRFDNKHAHSVIELNCKYAEETDTAFITIQNPNIKNNVSYSCEELMYAYTHNNLNELVNGKINNNQNEFNNSIPQDAIRTMHTLCNEIRLLEYKNFNDDSIAKTVEAAMNSFMGLKNASNKEANSIISKMKTIKHSIEALDSQSKSMDDAINDLQDVLSMRAEHMR